MSIDRLLLRARKLMLIATTPSYRRALWRGVAASTEHHYDPIPPDIRTVIDVGANRGQFAVVARERWPLARLICFEPLPHAAAVLRRALGDDPAIEVSEAAVGTGPGMATIHVSRADDSSSLLPITEFQSRTFPGTEEVATLEVPTTSLDRHLSDGFDRPALLKLDVQGFELEALRGAVRTLGAIDVVLVECSFAEFYRHQANADQVIWFLHEHGFSLSAQTAPTTDRHGVILQVDLIFTR